MHRIPYGRDQYNVRDPNKPVVFVMHGLLSSSADMVITGPGQALGYALADGGYDVWLGNARGTTYSQGHATLNMQNRHDKEQYWNFSWHEIGEFDLPAMIDYTLQVTGKSRLHYVGHSQGTTAFWVMASTRPEYNEKIISMQAFAPVAYLENNSNNIFLALAPHSNTIYEFAKKLGIHQLFPNNLIGGTIRKMISTNCGTEDPANAFICTAMQNTLNNMDNTNRNLTLAIAQLSHTPAGISVKQLAHYGQHIGHDYFRRFDYGSSSNVLAYMSINPPSYDLSKITAPVFFHYAEVDIVVELGDMDRLSQNIGGQVTKYRVPDSSFGHVDFVWSSNAKTLVYDHLITLMKQIGYY